MEFSRPEYWSGKLFPSAGDISNPGIELRSPALQILYHLSHRENFMDCLKVPSQPLYSSLRFGILKKHTLIVAERISFPTKILFLFIQFSSVQSLSRVQLFANPCPGQASLSITISRSSLRLTSIESVMPSSHLILCRPLLLLPHSLQGSESFPMSQLFA